jgi:predicted ribosome quality control (RQC) complex YloA/Tae2 family protein
MLHANDEIRQLKKEIRTVIAKTRQQLEIMGKKKSGSRNALWLQQIADSLSKAGNASVKGEKSITLLNIHTKKKMTVSLNSKLSRARNAALYAKKAAKAAAAERHFVDDVRPLEKRLEMLLQVSEHLGTLDARSTGNEIAETVSEAHTLLDSVARHSPDLKSVTKVPFRHYAMNGWELYAGKTEHDNDELSIKFAHPNDVWFHVAHMPGSHVIIRRPSGKPTPPDDVLRAAASLAAWFSKARNAPSAEVHCTEARHVRKRGDAPPGEVCIERFKSIKIVPRSPDALFGSENIGQ